MLQGNRLLSECVVDAHVWGMLNVICASLTHWFVAAWPTTTAAGTSCSLHFAAYLSVTCVTSRLISESGPAAGRRVAGSTAASKTRWLAFHLPVTCCRWEINTASPFGLLVTAVRLFFAARAFLSCWTTDGDRKNLETALRKGRSSCFSTALAARIHVWLRITHWSISMLEAHQTKTFLACFSGFQLLLSFRTLLLQSERQGRQQPKPTRGLIKGEEFYKAQVDVSLSV